MAIVAFPSAEWHMEVEGGVGTFRIHHEEHDEDECKNLQVEITTFFVPFVVNPKGMRLARLNRFSKTTIRLHQDRRYRRGASDFYRRNKILLLPLLPLPLHLIQRPCRWLFHHRYLRRLLR